MKVVIVAGGLGMCISEESH